MVKKLSVNTGSCEFFEGCFEYQEHGVSACYTHHCCHPNGFLGTPEKGMSGTARLKNGFKHVEEPELDEETECDDMGGML